MPNRSPLALSIVALTLTLAALACDSPFAPPPDTAATVNAISTSVQQTLAPVGVTVVVNSPTPGPTATPLISNPTAIPSSTSLPVSSSPTPGGPLTRPNGEIIHATRLTTAPTIDGDVSEWPALPHRIDEVVFQPANWSGVADNSADFALGWDAVNLYLAIHVTDDVHVQTQHAAVLYRGDSLELQFDADLAGDFSVTELSSDDFQLGFSPGDFAGNAPEVYLWNPSARSGAPTGVVLAARADGSSYWLEAAIPWTLFNLTPAGGNTYGLALNSSDNDLSGTAEQQSMISSSPARMLLNPTTWGTLMLDE